MPHSRSTTRTPRVKQIGQARGEAPQPDRRIGQAGRAAMIGNNFAARRRNGNAGAFAVGATTLDESGCLVRQTRCSGGLIRNAFLS
jgi:hypothetical protein